ncbi:MAG: hypothetical protein K0Q49_1774 [Haloplasmataceae bacterium]|nr:hypothetical protein [Haloplasmataceae bacterium]
MTEDEIQSLDNPRDYKKRKTIMDDYINIIYKMMRNNIKDDIIYYYIKSKGYNSNLNSLFEYINIIEKNNFPKRIPMSPMWLYESTYPVYVIVIKRNELLKYLSTINPKINKDKMIQENIRIIKEKYQVVEELETIFHSFHTILMGEDPNALDTFNEKYQNSKISSFCESIKKDITPVKNAISYEISSGFVEGNNNKFKLIKRIVYGRSKLVNLTKKCLLAFSIKKEDFNLLELI